MCWTLTPKVMVHKGGAFGTLLGLDEVKRVKFHDGINVLGRMRETTGNSLVIRPSTSTVGGTGLPLVGRTKIPHAARHSQKKKRGRETRAWNLPLSLSLSVQSRVDTVRRLGMREGPQRLSSPTVAFPPCLATSALLLQCHVCCGSFWEASLGHLPLPQALFGDKSTHTLPFQNLYKSGDSGTYSDERDGAGYCLKKRHSI